MLRYISVCVSSETRSALVETGEHLSPKYEPPKTAPPIITGSMPNDFAIVMQMTPIVADVPKAVPVKKDIAQHRRKVSITNISGLIIKEARLTITGIVPQARHNAVIIPISIKVMRMFLTVFMPLRDYA